MSRFYQNNKQEENMRKNQPFEPMKEENKKQAFRNVQYQEERDMRKSVVLKDEEGEQPTWCTQCCACTKLQYYKDNFKVTNKDVVKRIMSNLQFWSGGFFEPKQQDYDYYGPFWIYTTVVFCLSAVHNILSYQGSDTFQYDFAAVGKAFGFVYIEGFVFPILFTFLLKFLGAEVQHSQIICLYGYSLSTCVIAVLLCSINVCILHIVLIAYAMGAKAAFVVKNINEGFTIASSKKLLVIGIVIAQVVLQFFVFKLGFIICSTASSVSTPKHELGFSGLRNFSN